MSGGWKSVWYLVFCGSRFRFLYSISVVGCGIGLYGFVLGLVGCVVLFVVLVCSVCRCLICVVCCVIE